MKSMEVAVVKIYRHLDWLSVTIPDGLNWRQLLPGLDWRLDGRGKHGYRKRYVDKLTGMAVETDSLDALMGAHFTMTGEPLAELRALRELSDDQLAQDIERMDGKCSRIDMAIDCWGATFTPAELNKAITDGSARVPARTWRFIGGHREGFQGDTVETGSQLSDRRLRFYDKRAEMRIKDGEAWVRLELQLRRLRAKNALASCAENGAAPTITGHMGDYLRWQNEEYSQVLTAESAAPSLIQRTEPKRRAWLKGQVARALAAEIVADDDFKAEFDQMVNFWIDELLKGLTDEV
jgi:hypothetical protein